MSNTFITPSAVIADNALFIAENLIVGNLANRKTESEFAKKVGDTVTVKVPPVIEGKEFTAGGSTTASDVTETSVDVVLQKHFYVRVDLTSDELTLKIDDFLQQVALPATRGLIKKIEVYAIQKLLGGFSRYVTGTIGNEPSTHAHILNAEKTIFTNQGDTSQLAALITPTAHVSFGQLDIFTSADYGTDRPFGLKSNSLGMVANTTFFRSAHASVFDRGDIAGTVLTNGDPGTAAQIAVDGFTAATGTVYEGTRFTIADDSSGNVYTVTENAVIASNAATLKVTPNADASIIDGKALTFQAAAKANVMFNPAAFAGAILPGAIVGANVAAQSINNIGVRIISDVSATTLSGTWVWDCYVGFRVVYPLYGTIMCG